MKIRLLSIEAVLLLLATPAFAETFGSGTKQFTIDFVTIGDPGNLADTNGDPNPAGSVPYVYRMGKYEISRDMVQKANEEGKLGITLADMSFVSSGTRAEMPATGVSWNEAARFVNYLNTSQGYPPAYKVSKQPEDIGYEPNANIEIWQTGDAGFNANNLFRNSLAHYFLPQMDEWYKAAFYESTSAKYFHYPTGSDADPIPVASGTDVGTAVWNQQWEQGPADITQAGGLSPFGVMGLGGNALEWGETEYDLANDDSSSFRSVRGGAWNSTVFPFALSASERKFNAYPTYESRDVGFRVASIPEPSIAYPGAWSTLVLLLLRRPAG